MWPFYRPSKRKKAIKNRLHKNKKKKTSQTGTAKNLSRNNESGKPARRVTKQRA